MKFTSAQYVSAVVMACGADSLDGAATKDLSLDLDLVMKDERKTGQKIMGAFVPP